MNHLLSHWHHVRDRLAKTPHIALFLDFDGTLSHLRARPEHATLDLTVREPLIELVRSRRFLVWVISGRRLADVASKVGIPGIRYLGLHGWERTPRAALAETTAQALFEIRSTLETGYSTAPSIWIEDKEHALTIHYDRAAPSERDCARAFLNQTLAGYAPRFQVHNGKNVWEILPREIGDKGAAVLREFAAWRGRATPIYIGDDVVDEPAFLALGDGITIRVGGPEPTSARYRLSNVSEVSRLLRRLRTEFPDLPLQS